MNRSKYDRLCQKCRWTRWINKEELGCANALVANNKGYLRSFSPAEKLFKIVSCRKYDGRTSRSIATYSRGVRV